MAVDTPVLERVTDERVREYSLPSRMEDMAEEEHNARIKDTYQRLINPENKIEDVFGKKEEKAEAAQPVKQAAPAVAKPYLVENARANADIFRADSTINAVSEEILEAKTEEAVTASPEEYEDEDLRPTSTTIQFQTIGGVNTQKSAAKKQSGFVFGKREKIIVAVFVAVVVALITLVIVNSAIISSLDAEIAHVQEGITTVRGAIAGVNSTVEEIIYGSISH